MAELETKSDNITTNTQCLRAILQITEENHKNLYHDISKEEIEEYIASLTNLDQLSPLFFDREMLKLFAKFKDGHTKYEIPPNFYMDKKLCLTNKRIIANGTEKLKKMVAIKDGGEFKEVKSIGGMDIKTILQELASMQSYETKEFMYYCVNEALNNPIYHMMLEITNENYGLDCVVENNGQEEQITVNQISYEKHKELGLANDEPYYSHEILENNVIRSNYRECREVEDYPFSKFVEDMKKDIESKNISQFVLDLRGNTGGNSSIVEELISMLKEQELKGVTLIDNGVFSSGRGAVVQFKREFNTPLIGEPTGGAIVSYGHMLPLKYKGKRFTASKRKRSKVFSYKSYCYFKNSILILKNIFS